jgi:hypothetical protein
MLPWIAEVRSTLVRQHPSAGRRRTTASSSPGDVRSLIFGVVV